MLLDECFAALDVLTIKMLQEIIVNLQQENTITICICDHQARDLLACVDVAMILSNGKIVAQDTPSNLVKISMLKMPILEIALKLTKMSMTNSIVIKKKLKKFNKKISVSGDKSISIRWVLFASLANGVF